MKIKKFPQFRKEAKDFLLNEEGGITEKKIVKLGLVMGALALMGNDTSSAAINPSLHSSHSNNAHTSGFDQVLGVAGGGVHEFSTDSHGSNSVHTSHSNTHTQGVVVPVPRRAL
jgi:hypothetical protein